MILNVKNPKNEITETYTDNTYIITNLLGYLFNKTVVKTKHIKRIVYKHNYTNQQTLTLMFDNNYKHEYINIPTYGGLLNTAKLLELI